MRVRQQKSASHACSRGALLALCALQAVWGADFIWRTSFVIEERRYFCLFDDAMVSMRYAENWAAGLGPVWNAGERVEGITNFAWTALMALLHLVPADKRLLSLGVQVIGLVITVLCPVAAYHLVRRMGRRSFPAVLAAGMVALYYPLSYWTLMGMETGAVALLTTLSAIVVVRNARGGRSHWTDLLAPAAAILVRDDALVPIVAMWAALFLVRPKQGRRWACYLAMILAVPILHAAGRHAYYGDWLPNTYYLKLSVPVVCRCWVLGAPFTWRWLWGGGWLPLAIVVLGGIYNRRRASVCLLPGIAAAVAYQIWAGGDAWERQRLVCPVMPLVLALVAEHIVAVRITLARRGWIPSERFATAAAVPAAVGIMLVINRPFLGEWPRGPVASVLDNKLNVQRGLLAREITTPDARVAVFWAGAIPYFSERTGVDLLGKSDPVVARQRVIDPWILLPGHNKYNVEHSIRHLQPDLFFPLIGGYLAFRLDDYFQQHYPVAVPWGRSAAFQLRVRKDSPRVRHDRLKVIGLRYPPPR